MPADSCAGEQLACSYDVWGSKADTDMLQPVSQLCPQRRSLFLLPRLVLLLPLLLLLQLLLQLLQLLLPLLLLLLPLLLLLLRLLLLLLLRLLLLLLLLLQLLLLVLRPLLLLPLLPSLPLPLLPPPLQQLLGSQSPRPPLPTPRMLAPPILAQHRRSVCSLASAGCLHVGSRVAGLLLVHTGSCGLLPGHKM